MSSMLVTLDVFQFMMSWLNADAFWNMYLMVVTLDVSHAPMGWSKAMHH